MDEFLHIAQRKVDRFIASTPGFFLEAIQPEYRGGTNRIFMARLNDQPVMVKYFVNSSRCRNELHCLRYLQHTGLTPRVIDCGDDRIIVMTRLAGGDLSSALAQLDPVKVPAVSRCIGRNIGKLVAAGLPSTLDRFDVIPWDETPVDAVRNYLTICRRVSVQARRYQTKFFSTSLEQLERCLARQPAQFECLFHEDISNAKLDGESFAGFFDLEMCRPGTWQMQLGVALHLCTVSSLTWREMLQGFCEPDSRTIQADDLDMILAMNHLYHWIRICRWGQWDGDPNRKDLSEASLSDADWHEDKMKRAAELIKR